MLRMNALAVLLIVAFCGSARADQVDDFVRAEMKKQKVPGVSIAVVKDGKVVKAQGYGFANLEHQVPAKRETVYQTGSVGKQFTAMAAMLLVEDGKLKLDDPIKKYLPSVPAAWKDVTVRHLLTHTSGIRDITLTLDLRRDYTEEELLQALSAAPIDSPPGSKWRYSNSAYEVLGILISKVAGRFYGDFLKERVFAPLEMKTARIISEADIIPNRAAGYQLVNGRLQNQYWVSPTFNTTADGALYVTVDDMIKWDAALTARNLLKKESYDAMWTPVKLTDGKEFGYGFGWFLGESNGHQRIHHGGAWQGFTTYIDRYPDLKLTVIVLTNLSPANPGAFATGIGRIVAPELTQKKAKKIASPTSSDSSQQTAPQAVGTIVKEFDKSAWIVFQAKNDDYWFGSDGNGVTRYDGKKITRFTTKDGLCNDRVREIKEDKSGNIFITTLEGLSKFDGRKFTTLTPVESQEADKGWKLQPDDLWFKSIYGQTTSGGPYRYDGKTLYHLTFPKHHLEDEYNAQSPQRSWSPYEVYSLYKDSKGNMWFGTGNLGLCRFDGKSLSWLYERHLTSVESGGSFGIRSMIEDKDGLFWFCNTRYRFKIFPEIKNEPGKVLIDYQREKGIAGVKSLDGLDLFYFMSIVEDEKRDLWMATYGQGVWRYDGRTLTHYPVMEGANVVTLFSITKDNHGNLWLGTHEAGPYKFNGKSFEKFKP